MTDGEKGKTTKLNKKRTKEKIIDKIESNSFFQYINQKANKTKYK